MEHIFRNSELSPEHYLPPPKYSDCAGAVSMLGKVTTWDPMRQLNYIWNEGSGAESEVSFTLEEQGSQAKLIVVHRLLTNPDNRLSLAGGWHTHLNILCDVLEGKTPAAFWRVHSLLEEEYKVLLAE